MLLHLHIPPSTYPDRIVQKLQGLYNEAARITEEKTRKQRIEIVQFALQYVREHYVDESIPQRVTVAADGVITIQKAPASNLRVFL